MFGHDITESSWLEPLRRVDVSRHVSNEDGNDNLQYIMDRGKRMADGTVFPRPPLAVKIEHPPITTS